MTVNGAIRKDRAIYYLTLSFLRFILLAYNI